MHDYTDAKQMAKILRGLLSERGLAVSHGEALELVVGQFGFASWNILSAKIDKASAPRGIEVFPAIPIFRIFDVDKAKEFYLEFLGFNLDWEHRFGDNFPLYAQISRDGFLLHISEHSGDASPGARAFIRLEGIEAFHAELHAKDYRYMKPGLETMDWGREVTVIDPFSNRLTFCEQRH